ncbi:MAG TPA: flagellar regulator YcgR PilZN domain-containing protein [Paucimonas sp.]|nr:flagellar regulator YcgR PilZN domain-containing protein [Paucimonas sp.]
MTDPSASGTDWERIAGSTQVLVRSRIEIFSLLDEAVRRGTPIPVTFAGNEALFISRLRHVDPEHAYILIDYSGNRVANGALLAAHSATLGCALPRGSLEFVAEHPSQATFEGEEVVRFQFPDALVICQRRAHRRIRTIPDVPLHCVADPRGALPFDCKIVDVGCGGLGAIVSDDNVALAPGTLLKRCRILHPRKGILEVDIEVRHCSRVTLPDGTTAQRTGCRFVGAQADIDELVKVFVLDLERKESGT